MRTMEKTVRYKKPINQFKLMDSTNFINTNSEELVKLVFCNKMFLSGLYYHKPTNIANHKEFTVGVC